MRKLLHVHLIKSQLHAYKSIFLAYGIVNGNPATKPIQYSCTAVLPREDMRTLTVLQYSGKHFLFAFVLNLFDELMKYVFLDLGSLGRIFPFAFCFARFS